MSCARHPNGDGPYWCMDCHPEQYDRDGARDAGDEGMRKALRAQRVEAWKRSADAWLARQPAGAQFVADDVVASIGLPDEGVARNNVVGAWTSAKSRLGLIEWTGRYLKSERVIGHGNLLRVWRVATTQGGSA